MPATCASNASATETAYSPAKPREAPEVRLTRTSLIMAPLLAAPAQGDPRLDVTVAARGGLDRGQLPSAARRPQASLLMAVGPELLEIGPQILGFLLVLDAREHHLGPRDFGPRVLDV